MKKNIFGKKLKVILIILLVLIALMSISVIVNRKLLSDWTPSADLVGKWTGKSEFTLNKGTSTIENWENWIDIEIVIEANGSVSGKIGGAEMVNCMIKLNRNWFESFIGIKTDYVIEDGYLKNGIDKNDDEIKRNISIPFDLADRKIKGSIFKVEKWKYPDPLFPRLSIEKSEL